MDTQEAQSAGQAGQNAPPRPSLNDGDTYRMMVLRFDQSEEEVDEQLLHTATELGIDVPEPSSPKSTLELVAHDVSTLDLSPAVPDPPVTPEPSVQSSSHTSESINAQSDSSIESRRHAKTPSLTAVSITSMASLSSVASQNSHYSKVRKGIRRLSTLRRRKASASAALPPLPLAHSNPAALPQRAATAEQASTMARSRPPAPTESESPAAVTRRRQVNSASYTPETYDAQPPRPPAPHEDHDIRTKTSQASPDLEIVPPPSPSTIEAQERSLSHPLLKTLRTTHLQEQLRFISFQASQIRLLHTAHLQAKRAALAGYKAHQYNLETTHADALVSLEHRHLNAEVDLMKGLEADKKGCDVKLKHMQAYCNPRSTIEGMPRREVTKADYRQLEQQYHIRNGMENLHTSKINVLREKQGKQLERILAKQEAELAKAEADFEQETLDLERKFRDDSKDQRAEFAQRRKRLVRRWNLTEGIERRKLELDSHEQFGKLPDIAWGGEESIVVKRRRSSSGHSSRESIKSTEAAASGEEDVGDSVLSNESPRAEYDASNMI